MRELPAVHRLLSEPVLLAFTAGLGAPAVKAAVEATLDEARRAIRAGGAPPSPSSLVAAISERLAGEESRGLLEVLNGSGILLHTNLGRAPLAFEALAAMTQVAGGYSNLEFDLERGERGSRYERVSALLRDVTGAEDSLVVNNCAAAILLVLDALAKGREVVVARSQLIEIGGGFRLPDVLRRSGATLVEVGATNRTYLADYRRALTARTALLMRSHPSNYRIEGFTAEVSGGDLAALGRATGIPTVEDLGSGVVVDLETYGLPHERTVQEAVREGLDLVAFSGDKLLGGPQAGIIVGRRTLIARLRTNPLLRALRVDKATLAALAATLRLYLQDGGVSRIPFYAMLGAPLEALRTRAEALATIVAGARAIPTTGYAGGGSLPLSEIASWALAVRRDGIDANALAARLRAGRPPLIARASGADLLVDLRTIPPARDPDVAAAFARIE